MKRLFIPLVVLGMLLTMAPAVAADDTATGVVTVSETCLFIGSGTGPETLDYGTHGLSQVGATPIRETQTATYYNCSTDSANIYAQGSTATSSLSTSSATWFLLGADDPCLYSANYYDVFVDDTTDATHGGVHLYEESAQLINSGVPVETRNEFDATLTMPCSGSSGVGETMTFQIILTAAF